MSDDSSSAASKFSGAGVEHPAKYLGSCEVADGQSQLLCQEAMKRLLTALKGRKEPKERLSVCLSLGGIRLKEATATSQSGPEPPLDLQLRHCRISYVFKEPRDQRSCGLVHTEADPDQPERLVNKFYAIRTVKSAAPLIQDLRELFQLVKAQQQEKQAAGDNPTAATAAAAAAAAVIENPQQTTTQPDAAEPVTSPPPADLMDVRAPQELQPHRQPKAASSSLGSLDELSELFSSQASLASSGVGVDGGSGWPQLQPEASFNPWAIQQPQPRHPHRPPMQLDRQLSLPHPAVAAAAAGSFTGQRKSSHQHALELGHVTPMPAYHDNKRPSDPGLLEQYSQRELFQLQQQYAQQMLHQQQQQQQMLYQQQQYQQYQAVYGPVAYAHQQQQQQPMYHPAQRHPYGYPGGHPQYQQHQQYQQQPPVWGAPATPGTPPPPLLPPTSATKLVDGDFVSVFDRPAEEEAAATAAAAKTA